MAVRANFDGPLSRKAEDKERRHHEVPVVDEDDPNGRERMHKRLETMKYASKKEI